MDLYDAASFPLARAFPTLARDNFNFNLDFFSSQKLAASSFLRFLCFDGIWARKKEASQPPPQTACRPPDETGMAIASPSYGPSQRQEAVALLSQDPQATHTAFCLPALLPRLEEVRPE
jgi:hypothetical protein